MRQKHHTDRDEEKKQSRIRVGISLFMLFILVFSSVAYFFTPDPNKFSYNGVRFSTQVDGTGAILGYTAKINGVAQTFYSRPMDTLDIALPEGFPESMRDTQVVVVLVDPADDLTPLYDLFRFELEKSLGTSPILAPAVTTESAQYAFPVYSCAQATVDSPVIFLTQGPLNITNTNNCITISGSQYQFGLLLDRLRYRLLGVTEN